MNTHQDEVRETRSHFPHWLRIPTRYSDCDTNHHVNNGIYYSYFDTLIVHYLTTVGNLDMMNDPIIPFCVENRCRFYTPLNFPQVIDAGLRVTRIGNSSVHYGIGLFADQMQETAAQGYFVHVFVNRSNNRPAPIPEKIRCSLQKLHSSV